METKKERVQLCRAEQHHEVEIRHENVFNDDETGCSAKIFGELLLVKNLLKFRRKHVIFEIFPPKLGS